MKMTQAVLKSPSELTLENIPLPALKRNQVIIKVAYCGICGSDIHIFEGKEPSLEYPVVPGHELSGKVFKTGKGVQNFSPGEKVGVFPLVGCGECKYCKEGKANLCDNSKFIGARGFDGGFASYVVVPANNVFSIPGQVSLQQVAFAEPIAVVINAARKISHLHNKSIAIVGCGSIGLLLLQVIKIYGARDIICLDPVEQKINIAKMLGANEVINPGGKELEQVLEKLRSSSVDLVFECVGLEFSLNLALNIVKKQGEVMLIGEHVDDPRANMITLENHELTVYGSCIYTRADFVEAINLIKDRKITLKHLISRIVPLSKIEQAFQEIKQGKFRGVKILVSPNFPISSS